jgi:hypothetical protein
MDFEASISVFSVGEEGSFVCFLYIRYFGTDFEVL